MGKPPRVGDWSLSTDFFDNKAETCSGLVWEPVGLSDTESSTLPRDLGSETHVEVYGGGSHRYRMLPYVCLCPVKITGTG